MQLKFKQQDFQTAAVNAITDLFDGMERKQSTFTIDDEQISLLDTGTGYGNALSISTDQMLANMQSMQIKNSLPKTADLSGNHYSIEMETGTGKTYVYTKTIFELNKQYGFTKFIIVVPSVAIREGVYKSFDITKEHFKQYYDNVPYRYFIYNSAKLSNVRDFASNNSIEIMIINIDAFKKSENIINQEQDRLNGEKAISFIQNTNPIVIIDEPQSVDNTDKAKEAIASLNPLCVLRYSATHREKVNLMYRLTPVDAYQMGLVKQICVSSNELIDDFNKPYIRLIAVDNTNGFVARLELDIKGKDGSIKRTIKPLKQGADLYIATGERDLYQGYTIAGIDCTPGYESIEFTNQENIKLGQAIGNISDDVLKKAQIRRTIETHLDKELRLTDKKIKVLSLFFIDEVKKYRDHANEEDTQGIYAKMFEECYNELMALPKYAVLKDKFPFAINQIHDGYFSQDKKGNYKNTKGDTLDDYNTYNTIMKDKEWLLSFDCPLRFIFSHSALKEGWDNPNVFQVCTLIENKSTFTCRQKIGRGLRLCVDQNGDRIEDKNINILHVIANESFAEFADNLQKEIEQETGVRFGILDIATFMDMTIPDENGVEIQLTHDDAQEILDHLVKTDRISKSGKIKDTLKHDLLYGTLDLPKRFEHAKARFETVIKKTDAKPPIRSAAKEVKVKLNKAVMLSPEFEALWDKIKQKTTYRAKVDTDKVVGMTLTQFKMLPPITKTKIVTSTSRYDIQKSGVTYQEITTKATEIDEVKNRLPDILRILKDECLLTRKTILRILRESGRIGEFSNNPQKFIDELKQIIIDAKAALVVDGISYKRLDGEEYYVQEIFDSEELIAYIDKNAVAVQNSVYDHIIYDSETVEKPFALALDNDPDVKMFFKLPDKFTINTPVGTYNPDWAVYLDTDEGEKLYFILETKGSTSMMELRTKEQLKIHCGKAHFECLEEDVALHTARDWKGFKISL